MVCDPLSRSPKICSPFQSPIKKVHVGIVGAGIGGLAAAIAFRRVGVDVTVLEAAEELREVCFYK